MAVAIPVTVLVRGEDEAAAPAETTTTPSVPLHPIVEDRGLKVSYQVPVGWKQDKKASAVRMLSGDRTVQLVVAAPAPAERSAGLLDDTLAAIRSGYRGVEVDPGAGKNVGGLRAKGAVVGARTKKGERLRILVAVAEGRRRAYLVEVFTAVGSSTQRLVETQAALNALGLRG